MTTPRQRRPGARRVVVVGSGTRFLSGISVYSIRLANALAERHDVALVALRRLLPDRLYPGYRRVGHDLAAVKLDPRVDHHDGIDWYWLPSFPRALAFLARKRPEVVILQWWTGTVLHTYLALALLFRIARVPFVIEFHEVLDTGEARMRPARAYVGLLAPMVVRLASAFAVHSTYDMELLRQSYRLGRGRPIAIVPHGLYDHYQSDEETAVARREAPASATNLLFFGVIRPYKGLEVLVRAFDAIPPDEIDRYWLTVVGETWEGWDLPGELIAASRYRDRITFVNRYVTDHELDGWIKGADVVVLPYLRSSTSGPMHVAMSYGLPVVVTDVGGNPEAASGYGGVHLVPPGDEQALLQAIRAVPRDTGATYARDRSWNDAVAAYEDLFDRIPVGGREDAPVPAETTS